MCDVTCRSNSRHVAPQHGRTGHDGGGVDGRGVGKHRDVGGRGGGKPLALDVDGGVAEMGSVGGRCPRGLLLGDRGGHGGEG